MAIKGFEDTYCLENIVEKGEIANFEQFHLFPQCFPKAFFFNVLKRVYMKERVNQGRITLTLYHIIKTLNLSV